MKYQRYPEYKPSGVEWLGEVPAHWDVLSTKRLFCLVNGSTPKSSEPDYWDGDIPWLTPDDLGDSTYQVITNSRRCITEAGYVSCGTTLVPPGSIVLSTRAPIGHLGIAGVTLCTNQGCRSLVKRSEVDSTYFYYVLNAAKQELVARGNGTTFLELSKQNLSVVPLPVPDFPEQRAIAAFLDRETARIDALIARKQRLIELLAEKRTALISQAVTKGLNSDARMKDSGVEWLGEIPAHWAIKRLKFLTKGGLVNGIFKKKDEYGTGTLLVNVFDVYRENFLIDPSSLERVETTKQEAESYEVLSGDMFFVRSSLKLEGVGKSACALDIPEPMVFECHVVRARPDQQEVIPRFLNCYLNSKLALSRLVSLANMVTMATLDQGKIKGLEIARPPLEEQRQIVSFIDQQIMRTESAVEEIRGAIASLHEYRASLISTAVTGKIDVRSLAKEREVA